MERTKSFIPMYRTVKPCLWDDPKVKELSQGCTLLWVYLLTNRAAHISGIYTLREAIAIEDVKTNKVGIDKYWQELQERNLAYFDRSTNVVWVVNMLKHQSLSPPVKERIGSHLLTLHNSVLIKSFLQSYPWVKELSMVELPESFDYKEENKDLTIVLSKDLTKSCLRQHSNSNSNSNLKEFKSKNKTMLKKKAEEVLAFLNERTGRTFEPYLHNGTPSKALDLIMMRMREHQVGLNCCRGIIGRKVSEWKNTDMEKYLRPETLFNKTKFEMYLGEMPGRPKDEEESVSELSNNV